MRWRLSATFVALVVLTALIVPPPAMAQRRGGGSASAGAGHAQGGPSGGGAQRVSAQGGSGGGHAVYRPGAYRGYWGGRYYRPYYWGGYYPYWGYYSGFYGPWLGFGWWGGYPWYPYAAPYAFYYGDPNDSQVRLEVKPRETEVYVDGLLAGVVDDFDGTFQRMHLDAGEHEIELYLQGYKSVRQRIMLTPGTTFRIKHVMQPLAAGEPQEPRPVPPPTPPPSQTQAPRQRPAGPPMGPGPQGPPPQEPRWGDPGPGPVSSNFGTLAIRVQPPGADVLIDGERWQGPDGQRRLVVEVAEGSHKVEIRKDGYENFTADVTVRRGEVTPLNVSLPARER